MTTGDLAAVLAKRLVTDWERPIQVSVQLPEQRVEQRPMPRLRINGGTKKILIIGARAISLDIFVKESITWPI